MIEAESISVVIPTFNRRPLIGRAIESVLAQTYSPGELIVVDDGSTDGTCAHLKRRFPEARVLKRDRRGVSAARNTGIAAASGDWISLLDSDDEWRPTKLERQVEALRREPLHSICHCDEIWIRNGVRVNPKRKHAKHGGWIFSQCLRLCAISPSAVVIEKSLLEQAGRFDETLPACEDYDLWLRICSHHPVLYVDQPLVIKYGGHADQLSRSVWGLDRFRIRAIDNLLRSRDLTPHQTRQAIAMLMSKIDIYVGGAEKRKRSAEVDELRRLRAGWHRVAAELGGLSA